MEKFLEKMDKFMDKKDKMDKMDKKNFPGRYVVFPLLIPLTVSIETKHKKNVHASFIKQHFMANKNKSL